MSIRTRLKKLEAVVRGEGKHTCGRLIFVDFDEEVPPIPYCAECKRTHRIRFVQFARSEPNAEPPALSADARVP
jgi:hypothetical protein